MQKMNKKKMLQFRLVKNNLPFVFILCFATRFFCLATWSGLRKTLSYLSHPFHSSLVEKNIRFPFVSDLSRAKHQEKSTMDKRNSKKFFKTLMIVHETKCFRIALMNEKFFTLT